jgi:hypothetical protein
LNDRELE